MNFNQDDEDLMRHSFVFSVACFLGYFSHRFFTRFQNLREERKNLENNVKVFKNAKALTVNQAIK